MGDVRLAGTSDLVGVRIQGGAYGAPSHVRNRPGGASGTQASLNSTLPYNPPRSKNCTAKDNTCKGWKALGSEYCAVHLKNMGLLAEWQEKAAKAAELKSTQTSDELE